MINRHTPFTMMLLTMMLALCLSAFGDESESQPASSKSGEEISWDVISSGGGSGSSTTYDLSGTVGQVATGSGQSTSYSLAHGYWAADLFGGGNEDCCDLRGDINHDGVGPDIADLVHLVSYMFQPPSDPPVCEEDGLYMEADINGDGVGPDIADLVHLVSYMFQPPSPAPVDCP